MRSSYAGSLWRERSPARRDETNEEPSSQTLGNPSLKSYSYDFTVFARSSAVRVRTNLFGEGYLTFSGYNLPINLIGAGKSKAERRARSIALSVLDQAEDYERYEKANKYLHHNKRESSRKRKKMVNAAHRHSTPTSSYHSKPHIASHSPPLTSSHFSSGW